MIWELLYYASWASILLPSIGGIYYYNSLDKNQKYFLIYSIFLILIQITETVLVRNGYNSVWFFEGFLFVELIFFLWFFNKWRTYSKVEYVLGLSIVTLLIVLEYLNYFVYHSEKEVSYTFPLLIIFFVFQSASMILKSFDVNDTEFNKSYVFWISFARLIYFMAILPFNIFGFIGNHLNDELKTIYGYTDLTINHLANITLNTLLMYSFRCRS